MKKPLGFPPSGYSHCGTALAESWLEMLIRFRLNACVNVIAFAMLVATSGFAAAQSQKTEGSSQEVSGKPQGATDPAKPDVTSKPTSDKPGADKQSKDADIILQRKKQLEDDTAKLLALANELKAEMDKSTKDTLSLGVVKKAEAVEKLAHKVRDEMKKTMGN